MKKVIIDADVILDFLTGRPPFANEAAQLIALCEQRVMQGYLTPLTCANVYYILRKVISHKEVVEKISVLLKIGIAN